MLGEWFPVICGVWLSSNMAFMMMTIEFCFGLIRLELSVLFFFVSIVSMPFGKHPRCHVSFDSLTLLSFSSPASRSARDPEEESSQLLSERRRGSFYHWKELPQRNQSYFSGKQCRYYSQLVVTLVVSRCKSCAFGFLHVK